MKEWDVFVSHSGEDKSRVVEPLVAALEKAGLRVWYDRFELRMGDRLRRSIDEGLKSSRYGIVVLSPRFFQKHWPQVELDGLAQREVGGEKVILPVWVDVDYEAVRAYSPTLSDRIAARWADGLPHVVQEILAVVKTTSDDRRPAKADPPSVRHDDLILAYSPEAGSVLLNSTEIVLNDELRAEVVAGNSEEAAFLAGLRDARGRLLGIAYGTTAHLGAIKSVVQTRRSGKDVWTVTLEKLRERFASGLSEVTYNGISPDELAGMRARRILLDERIPRTEAVRDAMLESYVRGMGVTLPVHDSPFPKLYAEYRQDPGRFLAAARLFAALYLRLSDVVEHVLALDLGLRDGRLAVAFKGRRLQRYQNVPPAIVSVTGTCEL